MEVDLHVHLTHVLDPLHEGGGGRTLQNTLFHALSVSACSIRGQFCLLGIRFIINIYQ